MNRRVSSNQFNPSSLSPAIPGSANSQAPWSESERETNVAPRPSAPGPMLSTLNAYSSSPSYTLGAQPSKYVPPFSFFTTVLTIHAACYSRPAIPSDSYRLRKREAFHWKRIRMSSSYWARIACRCSFLVMMAVMHALSQDHHRRKHIKVTIIHFPFSDFDISSTPTFPFL